MADCRLHSLAHAQSTSLCRPLPTSGGCPINPTFSNKSRAIKNNYLHVRDISMASTATWLTRRPCSLLSHSGGPQSAKTPRQTDTTPSVTRRRDTAVSSDPSLLPPKQRRTRNRRPLATRHNLTGYGLDGCLLSPAGSHRLMRRAKGGYFAWMDSR